MKNFKFKGDWQTTISLRYFAEKLTGKKFQYSAEKRNIETFALTIADVQDSSPDPTPAQIKTIEFIETNEEMIFKKIFEYHKYHIFPKLRAEGFTEDDYPELFSEFEEPEHLDNVLYLNGAIISTDEKDGLAYYDLTFEWTIDFEHGLLIRMHGLRPLGFSGIGDSDYEIILTDMGSTELDIDWDEISRQRLNNQTYILENGRFLPHPKYGKLKPWQVSANEFHPFWLIHEDMFGAFEQFYSSHKNEDIWQVNYVLEIAIRWKRTQFIDLLLSKQPDNVYPSIVAAIEQADILLIKRLLVFEKDINRQCGQAAYLYKIFNELYKNYKNLEKRAVYEEMVKYFIEKGANPYLQERWGRDSFYGFKSFSDIQIKTQIEAFVKPLCEINRYKLSNPDR